VPPCGPSTPSWPSSGAVASFLGWDYRDPLSAARASSFVLVSGVGAADGVDADGAGADAADGAERGAGSADDGPFGSTLSRSLEDADTKQPTPLRIVSSAVAPPVLTVPQVTAEPPGAALTSGTSSATEYVTGVPSAAMGPSLAIINAREAPASAKLVTRPP